jgi:hypothetical protein
MNDQYNLEETLLQFGDKYGASYWSIRDAVEGVQIFGGIGSGKTSGSGRMIALKYLKAKFGGLVLTVKEEEKNDWIEYCRLTGREQDLIIVEPRGDYYFNFLNYESSKTAQGSSVAQNLVQVLKTVIRASADKAGHSSDDSFWEKALDMLIANTIDLCLLAYGKVTIPLLYDLAVSIDKKTVTKAGEKKEDKEEKPTAFKKAIKAATQKIYDQIKAWAESQDSEVLKKLSDEEYDVAVMKAIPDARVLKLMNKFFQDNYITLSEKTRSVIDFTFLGFLDGLIREPIYSLFCDYESNFEPEDCLQGKIILINLPVKHYHNSGRDCQILFKYIWQRAMERRNVNQNGRPVFLWADESQNFLHEYDANCQATARSSRIATVYITQNLPNYYASMGGLKSEYRVKSFLGTLATKFFHANADLETNEYASELIGAAYRPDFNRSDTMGKERSATLGVKLELAKMVRPESFPKLRTGGPVHHCFVDAYMHTQGKQAHSPFNHKKVSFHQLYQP